MTMPILFITVNNMLLKHKNLPTFRTPLVLPDMAKTIPAENRIHFRHPAHFPSIMKLHQHIRCMWKSAVVKPHPV